MSRLLCALVIGLVVADPAAALCRKRLTPAPVYFVPAYPLTPAVWGGPAPAYVPPPRPAMPKPAVRESEDPPLIPKKKDVPEKPTDDAPKVKPKVLIPGDPPARLLPEPAETGDAPKAFDQFLVPAESKAGPAAEVKVGFFNHSTRELVLTVHGEDVKLPGGQYVTLRLPRSFEWGEKGKKGAAVTVPGDADGVEIVFRK